MNDCVALKSTDTHCIDEHAQFYSVRILILALTPNQTSPQLHPAPHTTMSKSEDDSSSGDELNDSCDSSSEDSSSNDYSSSSDSNHAEVDDSDSDSSSGMNIFIHRTRIYIIKLSIINRQRLR